MNHVKPMTKAGKMTEVIGGMITKTIRPIKNTKQIVEPGHTIMFHEWTGRPYRSPWGRRHTIRINNVEIIRMFKEGIHFYHSQHDIRTNFPFTKPTLDITHWKDLNKLAIEDGFNDGKEMGEWFNNTYLLDSFDNNSISPITQRHFQIIDWGAA